MEKRQPWISVVMPVYNAQDYLADSIESVLNQSFRDLELIVVDDCSSDNSREVCKRYVEQDERVRLIQLKENIGAGMARNRGIQAASGRYLAFMDADDTIETGLYKKAVDASEDGRVDMIVWGATERFYNSDGDVVSENPILPEKGIWKEKREIASEALTLEKNTLLGYQWNKLYRRETAEKYEIRFEKAVLYEDFFFTIRMLEHSESLAAVDTAGYIYNKRFNGSITTKFVKEYFELSRRRVYEMYRFCQRRDILEEAVDILGVIYLRYILSGLMRNADPQSKMKGSQQKTWVHCVARDELYLRTAAMCRVENPVLKLLQNSLNKKRIQSCLLLGKGVYEARKYGPLLFEKIKRK